MVGASWKSKYIYWYKLVESVFGTDVPHLTDNQIEDCVSDKDWIIIPIVGERSKQDARKSQRPNLYFSLSQDKKVVAGITYDKIEGVRRFREIISPFNEKYRAIILERLEDTLTTVSLQQFFAKQRITTGASHLSTTRRFLNSRIK